MSTTALFGYLATVFLYRIKIRFTKLHLSSKVSQEKDARTKPDLAGDGQQNEIENGQSQYKFIAQ